MSGRLGDQRREHEVGLAAAVVLLRERQRRGGEHAHGVRTARAEHPDVAPRDVGKGDGGGAAGHVDALPDQRLGRFGRRGQAAGQRGHEWRPAAVEQPRLRSAAGILAVQLLQHRVDGLLGRLGHAQPLVAVRHPRLVVDDGVPARQVHRCVVRVGEDAARPRQADPQHELLEDRRSHPEGLDPGHVLAGQDEVDALAAAPPGEVFEQLDGLVGDGVLLTEKELELVDDRDDARPRTRHARRAQLLQLGDLVLLGHLGAMAHLRGEVLQQRQPELTVSVDVDTDEPRVR